MLIRLAMIAAGGYWIWKYFKSEKLTNSQNFRNQILNDAAQWLAAEWGMKTSDVFDYLVNFIKDGKTFQELEKLLRIECEVLKTSPSECRITVRILVRTEDSDATKLGSIERHIKWEYLPDDIRTNFIHENSERQIFLVVEKQEHQ